MAKKLGVLLAVLLVLTLVGPLQAQEPVTFIWGAYTNPVQLYSAVVTDGVSFFVLEQGCESLLAFDGATTNVIPSLATELTANEDLTVWTAKLREGVTFLMVHHSTPRRSLSTSTSGGLPIILCTLTRRCTNTMSTCSMASMMLR